MAQNPGSTVASDDTPVAIIPLAVFSMVLLALEVLLTRMLSYSVHTLLLYVVLGIAMLGFGAAGSLVAVRSQWLSPDRVSRALAWAAILCVLSIIGCHAAFVRLTPLASRADGFAFAVATVLTLPFLTAGTVITLALSSAAKSVGKCYAANLIGSGLGCYLPLVLLGPLDGEHLLATLAGLAWIAAFMYVRLAGPATGSLLPKVTWGALCAVVFSVFSASKLFALQPEPPPLGQVGVIRKYIEQHGISEKKLYDRWNSTGRVEIFGYDVPGEERPYPFLFYAQDSSAGSSLLRWQRRDAGVSSAALDDSPSLVARMCTESIYGQAYFRYRRRVLVIGVGGGPDLQCAVYHKAQSIDAVEINGDTIAAIQGPFDRWLGGVGSHPNVHFHRQDGRSFVHGLGGPQYDLIQISGADTKQNLASGSLTLNQNHLYTREAFVDYLQGLSGNGILSIIRFGEKEALRLANTAVAALRQLGIRHPERNIAILQSGVVRGVVVHRTLLSTRDIEALQSHPIPPRPGNLVPFFYAINGNAGHAVEVKYTPKTQSQNVFGQFFSHIRKGEGKRFEAVYAHNISPPSDDRPFFFDTSRYDKLDTWFNAVHLRVLRKLLFWVLLLSLLLILVPVWRMKEPLRGFDAIAVPLFFSSVGLGYLIVEVWMLHRFSLFLGHQTYSFSVVLSTLLVSTGIGAWAGERIVPAYRIRALIGSAAVVVLLISGSLILPHAIEATFNRSVPLRALVTIAFVAPTGMVMGLPFPSGLNWIQKTYPKSVPWCIGVNGFASVLATIVVIPVSLLAGYTAVLLAGMALYAVAALHFFAMRKP